MNWLPWLSSDGIVSGGSDGNIHLVLFILSSHVLDSCLEVDEVIPERRRSDLREDEVLEVEEGGVEVGRSGFDDGGDEEGKRVVGTKGLVVSGERDGEGGCVEALLHTP